MKIIAVIPARYDSSRFPGKPLANICGKPMIWWVYNESKKVPEYADVIVATDSIEIQKVCVNLDLNVILTSDVHNSGTDRVAEVAQKVDADYYVIKLGDEPMIKAEDERKLAKSIRSGICADAFQLVEEMNDPVDVVNTSTVKLAINDAGYCVFLSRAPIPVPKAGIGYKYFKSVGCIAMSRDTLEFFTKAKRGNLELAEDIEQLRLIENHRKLYTVKAEFFSMAVDTQKDLDRIQKNFNVGLRDS